VADGYTVANLAYRYSSDAPFPAQLEDCKAAIRWLRSNGAQFHIDAQRIGVWGGSAGGHLASLLGVTGHVRDFDRGENLAESSRVQCVVNWFGPSDFFQYGVPHWAPLDTSDTAISRLLGGLPPEVPEKARQASPVHQITPDAAPFITFHGDADPLVPLQQSSLLHQRLLQARVESTLHILKGAGHGGPEFNTPEVLEKIAAFFGRHLMDSAWNGKQAGN
jgi:acetyl esterase/lipase